MELSGSDIKKFLMFSYISGDGNPEKFPFILGNETAKKFLILMELLNPSSKTKKNPLWDFWL